MRMLLTLGLLVWCCTWATTTAEDIDIDIVYPQSANVFDVVRDGGVDNSGKTDVTAQLQQLISERSRSISILYFPRGTYRVSGSLVVKIDRSRNDGSHSHGPWIVGESRSGTVIRLSDGTWPEVKYQLMEDRKKGSYPTALDHQVVLSTGDSTNTTFNKIIRNLTVNVGSNNAGAIGLQYCVSNSGFLGEVDIISEDGKGTAALALAGVENGPGQVRNVRTRGFDIGFYNRAPYVMSVSHLTITEPNSVGVFNAGMLAAENITVTMSKPGPAFINKGRHAAVIGAHFTGVAGLAVDSSGPLYLRDATATGYTGVIKEGQMTEDEHIPGKVQGLFRPQPGSLKLPIKATPITAYEKDMSKWANVLDYGAVGDGSTDDTEAIQRALDDPTKTTVVFPYGGKPFRFDETRHLVPEKIGRIFLVTKPLILGPTIERVVGVPGRIKHSFSDRVTFTIGEGKPQVVTIEGMNMPPIVVTTDRTVVISSCRPNYPWDSLEGVRGYEASTAITFAGAGDAFLNDCPNAFVVNNPKQRVWVRFFNDESGWWLQMPAANVFAGSVWILGWKSEAFNRRVLVKEGGRCELIGFNSYSQSRKAKVPQEDVAIADNQGGELAIINIAQDGIRKYGKLVEETHNGETKVLTTKDNGSPDLGLYTSFGPAKK